MESPWRHIARRWGFEYTVARFVFCGGGGAMEEARVSVLSPALKTPLSPVASGIRIIAGLIFATAAVLKIVVPSTPLWLISWGTLGNVVLAGLIALEIALAVVLLSGATPRWLDVVVALCFLSFAGYSFYLWSRSAQSCGCFGRIIVPPAVTGSIDLAMAGLLLGTMKQRRRPLSPRFWAIRLACSTLTGIAAAALVVVAQRAAAARAVAALSVDQDYIDFGTLTPEQAKNLQHQIILTNHTSHSVDITDIEHTCSCTSVSTERRSLAPGQSMAVVVSINWGGHVGGQLAGVTIRTHNPDGQLNLTLAGTVNIGMGLTPAMLNLGVVKSGSVVERTIMLARTDHPSGDIKPLVFKSISPSARGIYVTPNTRADQAADQRWFQVTANIDQLPQVDDEVRVLFVPSDPTLSSISLPIRYSRSTPIEAITPALRFSMGREETQVARFRIADVSSNPTFSIVSASGDSGYVIKGSSFVPGTAGHLIDVVVQSSPTRAGGFAMSRLVVQIHSQAVANVSLLKF